MSPASSRLLAAGACAAHPCFRGRVPTMQQGRCNGTGLPFSSGPCLGSRPCQWQAHSLTRTTICSVLRCACVRPCRRCGAWLAHAFHIHMFFSNSKGFNQMHLDRVVEDDDFFVVIFAQIPDSSVRSQNIPERACREGCVVYFSF